MEIVLNLMERYGNLQKLLVSYRTQARLTPTLTHVVTRDPMTSGAEDKQCHHYMQAEGLRAEGFVEAEHFWTGSVGKQTA